MNGDLKKFESFKVYSLNDFYYSSCDFDRYVGFFVDKETSEKGYIFCIDLDEIDLELFKKLTECDITVKQRVSLDNEIVVDIFKSKSSDKKDPKVAENFSKNMLEQIDFAEKYNDDTSFDDVHFEDEDGFIL